MSLSNIGGPNFEELSSQAYNNLTTEEQTQIQKIQKAMASLKGKDKTEAEDYLENVLEELKNGKTADSLAKDAPDALKKALSNQGVSLDDVLENLEESTPDEPAGPPPDSVNLNLSQGSSIMQTAMSQMDESDKKEAQEYMRDAMDKIRSGEYDLDDLADDAPEALKNALSEMGVDISTILTDMANKNQEFLNKVDYSAALVGKLDLHPEE